MADPFLTPVQTQVALFGGEDTSVVDQAESVIMALESAESGVVAQGQKTLSRFERFIAITQAQFEALLKENQAMGVELVDQESRQRELTLVHKDAHTAVLRETEEARHQVEALRQEMIEVAQRAEAQVAAILTEQTEAVRAVKEANEARIAIAHHEAAIAQQAEKTLQQEATQQTVTALAREKAAVQAATEAGSARFAHAKQEKDELDNVLDVELSKVRECLEEVHALTGEDAKKWGSTAVHILVKAQDWPFFYVPGVLPMPLDEAKK